VRANKKIILLVVEEVKMTSWLEPIDVDVFDGELLESSVTTEQ
jgi:hypothetical protein